MHRPQLDGLRAFAVSAVLFDHFWPALPQLGHEGVRLFFVLSGFLITAILLDVRAGIESTGVSSDRWTALWRFYGRRFLRIFPAYYLTLAVLAVAANDALRHDLWVDALQMHNLLLAWRAHWSPFSTIHLWSLSLEEQFYLVWPLIVLFAPRRSVGFAIGACIVVAPVFRALALEAGVDRQVAIWVLPPSSVDALGFGALLAVLGASPNYRRLLVFAGLVVAVVTVPAVMAHRMGWAHIPFGIEVVVVEWLMALVFATLVAGASDGFGGLAGRLLSAQPVQYLGRISYGVYLYHLPIFYLMQRSLHQVGLQEPSPGPLRMLASSVLTLLVAAASWRWLEEPLNRFKRHLPYRSVRQTEAGGVPVQAGQQI